MRTRALLSAMHWEAPHIHSKLLSSIGVEHGFFGRDHSAPESHHVRQVHGTRVVSSGAETTSPRATKRVEADALYTTEPGTTISVKTADCIPVLLAVPGEIAAAIHAGWRGLTSGIIEETLLKIAEAKVDPKKVYAAVGPTISRERFEVGPDVVDALLTPASGLSTEQAAFALSKGRGDRWHLDLAVSAALALANAGVPPEQISIVQACTFANTGWHSFRRDIKNAGVNWSWITFK